MKKKAFSISVEMLIGIGVWLLILVALLSAYGLGIHNALKKHNTQAMSIVEEVEQIDTEKTQGIIMVASDRREDGEYIKIQDRMSMDFSVEDVRYIYAFIDIRGGSVEDRALNMVIMLNNIYDSRQSIKDYVTYYLGPNLSFEFKDAKADREAYRMVTYEHWDESDGARWFTK